MKSERLDTNSWKIFDFNKVFSFERGKRYKKEDHVAGEIPYISSTKFNNGIDSYVTPPEYMKIYKNTITLNNSGSIGYCFYHPYNFICSDHCTVINILDKNQELNIYLALFLKPIIEKIKIKYGFSREMSDDRLRRENVLLPADKNGSPDWKFMEDYIKKQSNSITYSNRNIMRKNNPKQLLDIREWEDFSVGGEEGIFNINTCRCNNATMLEGGDDIFYIGAKKKENGVVKRVAFNNDLITNGNCIAFVCDGDGAVGYNTYQPNDFIGTTNVKAGYSPHLNQFVAMFIITLLDRKRNLYSHGRKRGSRLNDEKIKLPIDNEGNPDWKFMEDYIKSLPYSKTLED